MSGRDPLSARGPLWLGTLTLVLLLAGTWVWGLQTRLAGAVMAPGRVEADGRRQVLQHPEGGIIAAILTREGASVAAGDVLLRLDDRKLRTELTITEAELSELLARIARLRAEESGAEALQPEGELLRQAAADPEAAVRLTAQTDLFEARRSNFLQQLSQMELRAEQIRRLREGLSAQIQALQQQALLIGEEAAGQQQLFDRGLAQISRLLALRRETARLEGEEAGLRAAHAQAGERLSETRLEALRLQASRREQAGLDLREASLRQAALTARRADLTAQIAGLDLRAPVAGHVLNLTATTPRGVLRAAEPALYIVPEGRGLVVSARIPSHFIDQIHPGQEVRLILQTLSHPRPPELRGEIRLISADALGEEGGGPPFYRAEITVPSQELAKTGDLRLQPGMPVEAWITTQERTPLQFLTGPVTDYFARAFRES